MRYCITTLFTIFLFSICLSGWTQKKDRLDSLNRVLASSKPDSNRVKTLYGIVFEYQTAHPDTAILYAQQGLELSQKIGYAWGECRGWFQLSYCENERNNIALAFKYAEKSLQVAQKNNLEFDVARAYERLGGLNGSLNYLEDGLSFFQLAEAGYLKLKRMEAASVCYVNIGGMYAGAAYIADKEKKDSLYRLALKYNQKGLEIRREIRRTSNPTLTIVTTLTNIAQIHEALNEDSTALAIISEAEVYAKQNGNLRGLFLQKILRSKIFFKQGKTDDAEKLAVEAIADENNIYGKQINDELYLLLSNIYDQKKDYQKAYEYRVIQQGLLNKILYNPGALNAAQTLRKNLEEEKVANEKHLQKLYLIMFAGGLFVVLFILGLVYRNNIRQRRNYIKLDAQRKEIASTLESLRSTQAQLIQSEKMASLGELTAGIAHEIQNPLNFVNNFSEVSNELIDEMSNELNKGDINEAKIIAGDIKQNLEKINHHGKRADAIVKGMLQHSRSSSGQKEPTDINALCDEYLRLAYHGLRAKDNSFNATIKTDFDNSIGNINIIPQDIGRVILNLINNAFYAVDEKKKKETNYEPIVTVATRSVKPPLGGLGAKVEIKVGDNGNGIPQKVLEKIFQPFFTTKPTGQGTGLGLSLSYDIVTKGHGGELKVETKEGEGTTFIIKLSIA